VAALPAEPSAIYIFAMASEIIFEIREDEADGGYSAAALGHDIFSKAETLEELRKSVRDAVECHFGDGVLGPMPDVIRLRLG
jgi:hypothetical protein